MLLFAARTRNVISLAYCGVYCHQRRTTRLRIVRPGSVLGMQQEYLEACEDPLRTGRLHLAVNIDAIVAEVPLSVISAHLLTLTALATNRALIRTDTRILSCVGLKAGYHATIGDDVMQAVLNRQDTLNVEEPPSGRFTEQSHNDGAGDGPDRLDGPSAPGTPMSDDSQPLPLSARVRGGASADGGPAFDGDVSMQLVGDRVDQMEYMRTALRHEMTYPLLTMMTDEVQSLSEYIYVCTPAQGCMRAASFHVRFMKQSFGDTLHPQPYTLNPKPYTLNPTPYALHPTPYTLHPKP